MTITVTLTFYSFNVFLDIFIKMTGSMAMLLLQTYKEPPKNFALNLSHV